MDEKAVEKYFDMMFESQKTLSEKYGVSPEERQEFFHRLRENQWDTQFYHRVLTKEESEAMELEAYGLLYAMWFNHSLKRNEFEKVIKLSCSIHNLSSRKITRSFMEKVIELIAFTDESHLNTKDLMDIILQNPSEFMTESEQEIN